MHGGMQLLVICGLLLVAKIRSRQDFFSPTYLTRWLNLEEQEALNIISLEEGRKKDPVSPVGNKALLCLYARG